MVQEVWKATSRHWDPPFHIHCQDSGVHNLLLGIFPGTVWCLHISESIHMYAISVRWNMSVFTSSGLLKNKLQAGSFSASAGLCRTSAGKEAAHLAYRKALRELCGM